MTHPRVRASERGRDTRSHCSQDAVRGSVVHTPETLSANQGLALSRSPPEGPAHPGAEAAGTCRTETDADRSREGREAGTPGPAGPSVRPSPGQHGSAASRRKTDQGQSRNQQHRKQQQKRKIPDPKPGLLQGSAEWVTLRWADDVKTQLAARGTGVPAPEAQVSEGSWGPLHGDMPAAR